MLMSKNVNNDVTMNPPEGENMLIRLGKHGIFKKLSMLVPKAFNTAEVK